MFTSAPPPHAFACASDASCSDERSNAPDSELGDGGPDDAGDAESAEVDSERDEAERDEVRDEVESESGLRETRERECGRPAQAEAGAGAETFMFMLYIPRRKSELSNACVCALAGCPGALARRAPEIIGTSVHIATFVRIVRFVRVVGGIGSVGSVGIGNIGNIVGGTGSVGSIRRGRGGARAGGVHVRDLDMLLPAEPLLPIPIP